MLAKHGMKAIHTALSKACASSKICQRPDCIATGSLREPRQSMLSPLIPSIIQNQQMSTIHTTGNANDQSHFAINSVHVELLFPKDTISDQRSMHRSEIQNLIPLPFSSDFNNIHIHQADKSQPSTGSVANLKYGIVGPILYFRAVGEEFCTMTITAPVIPDMPMDQPRDDLKETFHCMNRNARRGKRANKGKRACSRQHRRKRRRRFGSHRR